jgi:pseudaminic acid biosynthesis-associated methylase
MTSPTDRSTTAQLQFWRGDFGDSYTERNATDAELLRARVAMWAAIMDGTSGAPPQSILEVGSNIGNNLRALRTLTGARLHALEPNAQARETLVRDHVVDPADALDGLAAAIPLADGAVDMAFTCGVLIHIHPDDLLASCREIHRVASRYIACVEYFSDKPEMIPYRGHDDRLFKRDFGGFWLDHFPDLRVVDYGFRWKRVTGLDNLTWWLFAKG